MNYQQNVELGITGKANGPLDGPPLNHYSMGGHPVTSVVAYATANGENCVSPFAEKPSFEAEGRVEIYGTLKQQILKFAKEIILHPSKEVWIAELRGGWLQIYLGEYGNVNGSINLGRILGSKP